MRRISDWIFIWCMQGSGGFPTEYSFRVCRGQADCRLNIHSVYAGIRRIANRIFIRWDQADFRLNIHSVYARVRWISDWIFIRCMNGSGGFPTEYSVGVWMGPADFWPNIHSVYEWVRQITDLIFIDCARWIGIEYSIVGMIRLGGSELTI